MNLEIKELKKKIEDHFASISEEQLRENLIKAGMDIYTDMELNFLEDQGLRQPNPEMTFLSHESNAVYIGSFYGVSQEAGNVCVVQPIGAGSGFAFTKTTVSGVVLNSTLGSVCFFPNSASDDSYTREVCL
jgi:hypothetical protein